MQKGLAEYCEAWMDDIFLALGLSKRLLKNYKQHPKQHRAVVGCSCC